MRISLDYGRDRLELEIGEGNLLGSLSDRAADLADPAAAVRAALEAPHGFPPLRRALTPDDHVTIVIDERLPRLADLLIPLLEHVSSAGVAPEAITLLCPPTSSRQPWLEELPEAFEEVRLEVHDPKDRRRLSYLATTRKGRRLYLNRSVVDADQVVVLSGRRSDPLLGQGGAAGAIYPALSDEATRLEMGSGLDPEGQARGSEPVREEAEETAWLLGAPFYVQVIEGAGDAIAGIVAGTADSCAEGVRQFAARWRRVVTRPADVVVATLSGDPARHTFADLAAALSSAARVVQPSGCIVLLTQARPDLGPGADVLLGEDDPGQAIERLRMQPFLDVAPALEWAHAARQAHLYLLSGLPGETVEELFATPLEESSQVQRLVDAGGRCLFLEDAHKALAVVENGSDG
jgi:nickel-dependent lactate racemase